MSSSSVDVKVVVLGQQGVGKTCLVSRYVDDKFEVTKPTVGAAFVLKVVPAGSRKYTLGIWDTAGQERFDCLSSFYCRGAGAVLLMFDLTDRASFERVPKWVARLPDSGALEDCIRVLVGTKLDLCGAQTDGAVDASAGGGAAGSSSSISSGGGGGAGGTADGQPGSLPRAVHPDECAAYARTIGARFVETSARTGAGVAEVFAHVAREHAAHGGAGAAVEPGEAEGTVRLDDADAERRAGGCAC
eukprot:TRINITY_DN8139_c0_g1_i2.p2 TRINITY_DN8139_c0_g1~~TRINITY_DN8139_c0_g1_i2.p2  ORF type:complete len:262 (-),score=112.49 TRINITY_DN8139_c0_g1_i2:34-768(-)